MIAAGFEVGERFRVRANVPFVLMGTTGTILHKYISVFDTYKVQLDGQSHARVMSGIDLASLAFEFSERVQASIATPLVRAGTFGTIGFAYRLVPDAYEVYFDGHILPKLMRARELERVATLP
jgi:hypothetical protein